MKDCYKQAKELLLENQHVLKEIAEFLCEKESITGKEFVDIYNRVTGKNAEPAKEEAEVTEVAEETSAKPVIDVLIDEQIIIAGDTPNEENNV
jgi:cell division protease FtsH